jgi:hypothetical protein
MDDPEESRRRFEQTQRLSHEAIDEMAEAGCPAVLLPLALILLVLYWVMRSARGF